jgi:hypothetical protein
MFGFENGHDMELVSKASEFLGDTLNIWDDDSALAYCIWRAASSRWHHYGVKELLWVFIKHQIVSYFLNFVLEILLTLTYDLGSTDQTKNWPLEIVEFPTAIRSFCWQNLSSNWKYVVVKQMSSNSITSSTCKGNRSGEEASVLSLFLMPCKTSSTDTFVNKLTSELQGSLRFEGWYPVLALWSVLSFSGARGSVAGWGTMLHAGRSLVRVPMRWIFF